MAEEIQANTQQNDFSEDFSLDQSRLATVLIGVLVILAGYLVYNYLAVDNQTTLPTNQSTTKELADNQPDKETLGKITNEGDFQTKNQNQPKEAQNEATSKRTYTVKQGDTLWGIAENQLGSGFVWVDIARENDIPVSNPQLAIGEKLVLPAVGGPEDTTVTNTKDREQKAEDTQGVVAGKSNIAKPGQTYTVQKGDTLWEIAQVAYGSGYDWVRIFDHPGNEIKMYTAVTTGRTYPRIEVGQQLIIPAAEQV